MVIIYDTLAQMKSAVDSYNAEEGYELCPNGCCYIYGTAKIVRNHLITTEYVTDYNKYGDIAERTFTRIAGKLKEIP